MFPFQVIESGDINRYAGPDFSNAIIRFDQIELAGAVEIHCFASDWIHHKHHLDPAYNQVILHVVLHHDANAVTQNGHEPITWSMEGQFPITVIQRYQKLMEQMHPIPCRHNLVHLNKDIQQQWMDKVARIRLESTHDSIHELWVKTNFDWEWTLRLWILQQLGHGPNKAGFQLLGDRIIQHLDAIKRVDLIADSESIVLGLAGLLNQSFCESHPQALQHQFAHYQTVDQLQPIIPVWNYMRIRPHRYPDFLLARWCQIFPHIRFEPNQIYNWISDPQSFRNWLNQFPLNTFWKTHFRLGKISREQDKLVTQSLANHLIINGLSPFLSYWNQATGSTLHIPAHRLLQEIKPENNRIIETWNSIGISPTNGMESQALLHLYQHYCTKKQCLSCQWGLSILSAKDTSFG